MRDWTPEQLVAIERREGDLLLDAGAGSGKTSVLVERFVRAVREDGVSVGGILVITFTEKAAGELRERIRARLTELGEETAARDTEGAWISTIHAFCARVLRAHALTAGLDPGFAVLDEDGSRELAGAAFDAALGAAAATPAGEELIAAHGAAALRTAILTAYGELRSRGEREPSLPPLPPAAAGELDRARQLALSAARAAAVELGQIDDPSVRVGQALDALGRAEDVLVAAELWPGDLASAAIPNRNGAAALKTDACEEYREALDALRAVAGRGFAERARDGLDALLRGFGERYARAKADHASVDFEDLELIARDLLAEPEIGERYRARFRHVMVDELQDTNRVQLELVDSVAADAALFMVGDAQQSIYAFRHADVELFEARGRSLAERGLRASLQTNFRSRGEILDALNAAFAEAMGEGFRPLRVGRTDPAAVGRTEPAVAGLQAGIQPPPRVELLIVDKGADWAADGLAAPWRLAEARVLAARVAELLASGECRAADVVVLIRASTDLAAYERALEAAGVPTYVIGGRGYWSHPQVVELVAYLRALANSCDQEALWTTLVSPLCGLSLDGLVLVAAGARDELSRSDAERLAAFEGWFSAERRAAPRLGVQELLDRAIARSGYDLALLARPDGRRRLANVRKLMRLGREWEAERGTDLRGFLGLVERRGSGARDSHAPVEGEALDAVRLMTIHRAKGLEFPVVCVADLGRGGTWGAPLLRLGPGDGRIGLRLGRPGSGPKLPVLDYDALKEEERAAEAAEERRLFYVAMTRARDRLILTGAAKLDVWEKRQTGTPAGWIVPAFIPDVVGRVAGGERVLEGAGGSVRLTLIGEGPVAENGSNEGEAGGRGLDSGEVSRSYAGKPHQSGFGGEELAPPGAVRVAPQPPVATLSYSGIAAYERCGYRFYAERVLGLPPLHEADGDAGAAPAGPSAAERGTHVHALLQALDFARPAVPPDTPVDLATLIAAFTNTDTARRLAVARSTRREQRFAFPLAATGILVTGVFDVLAEEPDGRLLVVDYKTGGARSYSVQRLVYAVAALRTGAASVEIRYEFLEAPEASRSDIFAHGDLERLEAELLTRTADLRAHRFPVTDQPHRALCTGCPALGGLCSWPAEVAMRPSADRLF